MKKLCYKCREYKKLEEFGNHKKMKDGLRSECRECNNKRCRDYKRNKN